LRSPLQALADGFGPRRPRYAGADQDDEEVRRGDLAALAAAYPKAAESRGEFTIVVEPPADDEVLDADGRVDDMLRRAPCRQGSVKMRSAMWRRRPAGRS